MKKCDYCLDGECQLYSKICDEDCVLNKVDTMDRLTHIMNCQEEIIRYQKDIIDNLFAIAIQFISVEEEEMRMIAQKINEAAAIRSEY
jgi:hypothetical protein